MVSLTWPHLLLPHHQGPRRLSLSPPAGHQWSNPVSMRVSMWKGYGTKVRTKRKALFSHPIRCEHGFLLSACCPVNLLGRDLMIILMEWRLHTILLHPPSQCHRPHSSSWLIALHFTCDRRSRSHLWISVFAFFLMIVWKCPIFFGLVPEVQLLSHSLTSRWHCFMSLIRALNESICISGCSLSCRNTWSVPDSWLQ